MWCVFGKTSLALILASFASAISSSYFFKWLSHLLLMTVLISYYVERVAVTARML